MSDSKQLVPYFSQPERWQGDILTDRMEGFANQLNTVFINIENQLGKKEKSISIFQSLMGGMKKLNTVVVQPLEKSANFLLERLSSTEKDAQKAEDLTFGEDKYRAIKYAAQQTGIDQKTLDGSIKHVNAFWKNDRQSEDLLNSMGIATRDITGEKRGNDDVFIQLARTLGSIDKDDASLHAGLLGIDEGTLNAMRRGLVQYTDDYLHLMDVTGNGTQQSAEQSTKFMNLWRELSAVVDLFGSRAEGALAEGLVRPINTLTEKILSKAPQIENVLDKLVDPLIWFGEILADVLSGIIDFVTDVVSGWDTLDSDSQSLIAVLTGLAGAWLILNSAFLASPVGIILSLIAALGLLYNDYQKWKSGGESFIDWDKWEPAISAAANGIESIAGVIQAVVKALGGWESIFKGIATYVSVTWAAQMISAISGVIKALSGVDSNSPKTLSTKFIGKLGFAGAAAVALEPVIDKGLNWTFRDSNYYQRIRTAPTWKDLGRAVIGEGDAKWVNGKWIDNRSKDGETQTDGWAQFSKSFPASLDSFSHLAQPGVESMMLSGYGNNSNWRYATSAEVQANTSTTAVSSPTWNNNTSIVINSASDPFTTGAEVEQRQLNIYARQAQLVSGGVT